MTEIEKKLWERVDGCLPVLQMVPFVKMVAVCNNLAFGKVTKESDIDLFVVAEKGRLFFVRTFVTFLLHVLGVRRHGNKVAGRFCLSFFVDEDGDCLEDLAIEHDIYLAFWVKSMVPVIDNNYYGDFLAKNSWIAAYFEPGAGLNLGESRLLKNEGINGLFGSLFAWVFGGRIGDFFEKRLMNWQLKRAQKKALSAGDGASLVMNEHVLKFHNIDRRREYRGLWLEKYGEKLLSENRFVSL